MRIFHIATAADWAAAQASGSYTTSTRGVSLDDELSHQRFAQKYNLPFPLLTDIDAGVARQYGTYKEKNMYGRSFWGIERTTFVIDREGKVENVFRRVKVEGHADEVLATLAV